MTANLQHCLGRYITSMEAAHAEQVAEAASTNTTTTSPEFRVTCPVCRCTDNPIIAPMNCFINLNILSFCSM